VHNGPASLLMSAKPMKPLLPPTITTSFDRMSSNRTR
jgi:hypothetical protein